RIVHDAAPPLFRRLADRVDSCDDILPKRAQIGCLREDTRHSDHGDVFALAHLAPPWTAVPARRFSEPVPPNSAPSITESNRPASSLKAMLASKVYSLFLDPTRNVHRIGSAPSGRKRRQFANRVGRTVISECILDQSTASWKALSTTTGSIIQGPPLAPLI